MLRCFYPRKGSTGSVRISGCSFILPRTRDVPAAVTAVAAMAAGRAVVEPSTGALALLPRPGAPKTLCTERDAAMLALHPGQRHSSCRDMGVGSGYAPPRATHHAPPRATAHHHRHRSRGPGGCRRATRIYTTATTLASRSLQLPFKSRPVPSNARLLHGPGYMARLPPDTALHTASAGFSNCHRYTLLIAV